jgi:hypothetical protein
MTEEPKKDEKDEIPSEAYKDMDDWAEDWQYVQDILRNHILEEFPHCRPFLVACLRTMTDEIEEGTFET